MENLLISACLLGVECKYSGGSNALPEETIEKLRTRYRLIPVCPETAGGLPTPRDPSERLGERVVSCRCADVTAQFKKGVARLSLDALLHKILKKNYLFSQIISLMLRTLS